MKKHAFNIFPEIKGDDYKKLLSDIQKNGYDETLPIIVFEEDIIDGWQRYKICEELGIEPAYKEFQGTAIEAAKFILRTNRRRNLTSSQWAAIANDATDIISELEKQAKERQKTSTGGKKPQLVELIPQAEEQGKTREKVADLFNTNAHYVTDAKNIKEENPEAFEEIKEGKETISGYKKKHSPAKKKDDSDPFFNKTNKLLTQALDHFLNVYYKKNIHQKLKRTLFILMPLIIIFIVLLD